MKQELIKTLNELYDVTVKLNELMEQDVNQTVNDPDVADVYPFEYDFQEMPMRIAEWIEVYKEKLEPVRLELTKAQFDMIYNAVCHLNWEVNEDDGAGWWEYDESQMKALSSAEKYLITKL